MKQLEIRFGGLPSSMKSPEAADSDNGSFLTRLRGCFDESQDEQGSIGSKSKTGKSKKRANRSLPAPETWMTPTPKAMFDIDKLTPEGERLINKWLEAASPSGDHSAESGEQSCDSPVSIDEVDVPVEADEVTEYFTPSPPMVGDEF